jgi:hypothetical protein
MIHEFEKGMDCINKLNTMHCLIQVRDAEMELHPTFWETNGIHLLDHDPLQRRWPPYYSQTTLQQKTQERPLCHR